MSEQGILCRLQREGLEADYRPHKLDSPERNLLRTLLVESILDWMGKSKALGVDQKRNMQEARQWFESNKVHCDPNRGISFGFVCEELGLERQALLERLRQGSINVEDLMGMRMTPGYGERVSGIKR